MRFSILMMTLLLGVSGCGSSSGGGKSDGRGDGVDAAGTGLQGLWLSKEDAEEFRRTGRIESLCEEIKKDPKVVIINIRSIEADGTTYLYYPKFGKVEQMKLGQILASFEFLISPDWKNKYGVDSARVVLDHDTLSFLYKNQYGEGGLDYLRSSEDETRRYYEFQDSCRQ